MTSPINGAEEGAAQRKDAFTEIRHGTLEEAEREWGMLIDDRDALRAERDALREENRLLREAAEQARRRLNRDFEKFRNEAFVKGQIAMVWPEIEMLTAALSTTGKGEPEALDKGKGG